MIDNQTASRFECHRYVRFRNRNTFDFEQGRGRTSSKGNSTKGNLYRATSPFYLLLPMVKVPRLFCSFRMALIGGL
jgi:hypothetical protein